MLKADGTPAATHEEAEEVWLQHFAGIEDGHVESPVSLAVKCLARQQSRDLSALMISREDLPSRNELEASLRAVQVGRAVGTDGLPGRPLFQLAIKIGLRMAEPLHFKGGSLHASKRIGEFWSRLVSARAFTGWCDSGG